MASMMRVVVPVCLLLASIVAITGIEGAVSCSTVMFSLYPCTGHLGDGESIPETDSCCAGIRMINALANSALDRQDVCGCIKSALGRVTLPPDILKNAASLPDRCRVHLNFKFDPSADCNSIN